jgi:hypothetical protein
MRAARRSLLVPLCAALASCSWQEFDDIKAQAPVRALGRPSDMPAADFPAGIDARIATTPDLLGTPILPVGTPRGNGELLVLGEGDLGLADYTLDAAGQTFTQTTPRTQFVLPPEPPATTGVELTTFEVAAPAPAGSGAPRFVGVADHQPVVVTLATATEPFAVQPIGDRMITAVAAIAAGPATAAGAFDLAIVAGSKLYVRSTTDASVAFACDLQGGTGLAVTVGEQWVAVSTSTGLELPFSAGACATGTLVEPDSGRSSFGVALAAGDLDGDGATEVAVSAPGDLAVHRFRVAAGPVLTWSAADTLIGDAATTQLDVNATTHFGEALAFGRIGGRPTLIIGDRGDAGQPGRVYLYRAAPPAQWVALDRPSTSVLNFGGRVGVLPFSAGSDTVDLLLVAANAATSGDPGVVYLFFRVGDEADPRGL